MIVSLGKGLRGLCEHRGDDDLSGAWQGLEDADVTMLAYFTLGRCLVREVLEEQLDLLVAVAVLLERDPQSRQQQSDMCAYGLLCARRRSRVPGVAELRQHIVRVEASDAVAFRIALDLCRPNACRVATEHTSSSRSHSQGSSAAALSVSS